MSPREEVTPGGVEVGSTECSLGPCRLPYLQRFAQPLPFTLILSLCSFSSTLMAPLFATQVTSLERQFELTSTQVGGLQSANDVGFLILVLVVAHFGKHSHTPRILALGTLIFGLAAFGISATNFLYPQSLKDLLSKSGEDHDHYLCLNSTTTNSSLGSSRNRNHTCEGGGGGGSGDSRMHVVILIGVLFSLQGVAKATRNPLGVSYIDDNVPNRAKTGLYVGILLTIMLLGPYAGLALGGVFNSIPVDLSDTAISSKDPRWISAWWLGFLIPATLSLIFALPLSCFPKRLTSSSGSQEDSQKSQESTDSYQDDQHHLPGEKVEHVCKHGDGEMPQHLKSDVTQETNQAKHMSHDGTSGKKTREAKTLVDSQKHTNHKDHSQKYERESSAYPPNYKTFSNTPREHQQNPPTQDVSTEDLPPVKDPQELLEDSNTKTQLEHRAHLQNGEAIFAEGSKERGNSSRTGEHKKGTREENPQKLEEVTHKDVPHEDTKDTHSQEPEGFQEKRQARDLKDQMGETGAEFSRQPDQGVQEGPRAEDHSAQKVSHEKSGEKQFPIIGEKENTTSGQNLQKNTFSSALKELPPSLSRLLGSPVYVLMILALALKIFAIFGFASFFIKFLHHTFDLEPRLGSYIFGGSSLVLNSLGTFSGGLLTTRVLKTRRHCLQYILIIHATSIVLTCTTIFLGCDARHIVGLHDDDKIVSEVITKCKCDVNQFLPVCGGYQTFLSPCHAGCTSALNATHFSGCKLSALDMVSVGVCSPGCKYLVPFIIVQVLSSAVRASSITPIYVIIIRSVSKQDKALALGIQSFLMSLLGFFPSPIVYGAIVDTTCLLWTSSCGRPGACALYDVTQLRFRYIGLEISGNVAAFLCSCLALTVLLWQIRTGRTEDDKLTAAGNMEVFVEEKRGNGKGGQGTECKDGVVVTRF